MQQEFAEGSKFAPLAPYFGNLDYADLDELEDADILAAVDQKHRVLAILFLKRVREKHLSGPRMGAVCKLEPDQFLNFRGNLISSMFGMVKTHRGSCAMLPNLVRLGAGFAPEEVVGLDLSACDLLDADLAYVRAALHVVPACRVVDLSANRLYGRQRVAPFPPPARDDIDPTTTAAQQFDADLNAILAVHSVDFVDITVNVLATADRIDLYQNLPANLLLKLVWIPQPFLAARKWALLIKGRPDEGVLTDDIARQHVQYYERYGKRRKP
jgi:hypothetical protein